MTEIFTMTKTCARESAVASAEPPPDLTVPDPISFRTNLADRALVFKPQMELRQIEQYLRQPEGSLNCLMRLDYPMKLIRLFLVKMSPVTGPVTRTAVREAFPGAEVVEVKTVEEAATKRPGAPSRTGSVWPSPTPWRPAQQSRRLMPTGCRGGP